VQRRIHRSASALGDVRPAAALLKRPLPGPTYRDGSMQRLIPFETRPANAPDDPSDDGPLADLVSGFMWLLTAGAGLVVLAVPGTSREHLGWMLALAGFAAAWGVVSLVLGVRAATMPIAVRALVTAAMMPVVALALWATGGADSYLQPILLFTALFLAYFFPPALVWPLIALFTCAYATPLLYDDAATSAQYGARVVTFAVAVTGEALAMRWLKRRLLWAEAHQRRMAERDPLTGVHNRRAFDAALANAAAHESTALLVFDFNNFKLINDVHGHPVGDAVLRSVALAGEGVIRDSDHLARIGGDEFALVARGAGEDGAIRLAHALDEAIREAEMPDGVGPVHATFAWAVAPLDGSDPEALLVRADERLLERKRLARAALR
jgi:diguanylate cyclase (GGDEF)-like protein